MMGASPKRVVIPVTAFHQDYDHRYPERAIDFQLMSANNELDHWKSSALVLAHFRKGVSLLRRIIQSSDPLIQSLNQLFGRFR